MNAVPLLRLWLSRGCLALAAGHARAGIAWKLAPRAFGTAPPASWLRILYTPMLALVPTLMLGILPVVRVWVSHQACPLPPMGHGYLWFFVPFCLVGEYLRRRSHIRIAKKQNPEAFGHLEGEAMSSLMARFSAAEKIQLQTALPEAPGSAQPRRRL